MNSWEDDRGLEKIVFPLEPAWHGSSAERLWAEPLGNGKYRLRNSPFFAFGVSFEDVVFAKEVDDDLVFDGVAARGGHSTYRIKTIPENVGLFEKYWSPLHKMGCSYEEGLVLAVDVPPTADIYEVYRLLEAGEAAKVWGFQEGHCGHPLRK